MCVILASRKSSCDTLTIGLHNLVTFGRGIVPVIVYVIIKRRVKDDLPALR